MAYANEYKIDARSDKHRTVVDRLVEIIRLAESASDNVRGQWVRNEELYSAYVDLNSIDRQKKANSTDKGQPDYVTLYVPYSYAMLLSAHTYICSTMFARNPIWQYQGRHGEAEQQVAAVESLIDYQVTAGEHMPHYYVWTHDSQRYGFGVLGAKWKKETIRVRRFQDQKRTFLGMEVPWAAPIKQEVVEEVPGYEGNEVYNVRPADFGWDPRVPVTQFQKGEMVTRKYQLSSMDLVDDTQYFNQKYLPQAKSSMTDSRDSFLDIPSNSSTTELEESGGNFFDAHDVYVRLIPSKWGLGRSDKPEKWYFIIVNKCLIVCARPMDTYSNRWPFSVTPGEVEGYDRVPRSLLQTTEALGNALSWLLNSHMFNVRAALNNQLVVDPSRLMVSDMVGPNPGKLIRMKPSAYGQDVRNMIYQLPVQDITRANVSDMEMVASLLQRTAGINDNMMGQVNSGRRTATESRATNTMGISRMKTLVEYQSSCAYGPLAQLLLQNSQQYYSAPLKLRIVGDRLADNPEPFLVVDPAAIAGFYDMTPVDGTMPIDRMAQVTMWTQFLQAASAFPQVMQGYDLGQIFAFVAQLGGIRNLKQFRVRVGMPGEAPPPGMTPVAGIQPPAAPGLDNSGAPVAPQPPMVGPVG